MVLDKNELPPGGAELPDRYRIKETLAATPAAVVLLAHDDVLHRDVVLKFPGPDFGSDDDWRKEQILEEARSLARLRHPQVNRILDVLDVPGGPLLVLEPVIGEPLCERIAREGPLPIEEVPRIGAELAEAMGSVHAEGVLHRALTTRSVLLDSEEHPVVTGFHFAGTARDGSPLELGDACAAPPTPAPEVLAGNAADARSDVFSIGWVLFECLAGEPPFADGADATEIRDLTVLRPDTPRELASIVVRALAPSPMKRFQDAAALASALRAAGGRGEASATTVVHVAPRPVRPTIAMAGIAAAVLLAVFVMQGNGRDAVHAGDDRGVASSVAERTVAGQMLPEYANSYALLIGIGDAYAADFGKLPNARIDVEALQARLAEHREVDRWQVDTILEDEATAEVLEQALYDLAKKTKRNDRVFIYYAGHGEANHLSGDSAWLVPADAVHGREASYVPFTHVEDFFRNADAKHILVALDCCYGGRLDPTRSASGTGFEERYLLDPVHVLLSAGHAHQKVPDGPPGEHSPFAQALREILDGEGPITTRVLHGQIDATFMEKHPALKPRHEYRSLEGVKGEFVFFRR